MCELLSINKSGLIRESMWAFLWQDAFYLISPSAINPQDTNVIYIYIYMYIYIYIYLYMKHPFLMFLDHTQRRTTVGRTPLDK